MKKSCVPFSGFTHDAIGRETGTSEEVAESSTTTVDATTSFVYDGDNNVTQSTDADGQIIAFAYNDLNQRTEEDWYDNSSDLASDTKSNTITTSYDLSGEILNTADTYPSAYDTLDSEYTFTYNTLGQQITADNNGSGSSGTSGTAGVPDVVLSSTYDALGDRTALNSTVASTADFQNSYTYDALGEETWVVQQGASGGNSVEYKAAEFSYTSDRQLSSVAGYGGPSWEQFSLYENYGYDHDGNMTFLLDNGYYASYGGGGFTGVELESMSMAYDSDRRLTAASNSDHSWENSSYGYDHDSQLTSASGYAGDPPWASGYAGYVDLNYDANGNLAGSGTSVGDGNTQLQGAGFTDTFDAAGHVLTQKNNGLNVTLYLTWDNAGDMTSVTAKDSSGVIQYTIGYTYDMLGDLIGRSYTPYSGGVAGTTQTQRFVIDPATGKPVLEFNGSGTLTDRFLWGPLVDQILADEKTSSFGYSNNIEWMFTNNTGSVVDVYDSNWSGSGYGGTYGLLDHLIYNAWGGTVSQSNSSYAPLFGYNGEFTDPITGLQYHNDPASGETGRWYNPAAQRWLSEDPIFPRSGSNPYEYCGNSPTNFIDPTGHDGEDVYAGIASDLENGNIEGATQLLEGLGNPSKSVVRSILSKIVDKFPPASQRCYQAAAKIAKVFQATGRNPVIVKIYNAQGGNWLRWGGASGVLFSQSGDHQAVLVDGMMYDSLLGVDGVSVSDYAAAWTKNVGAIPEIVSTLIGEVVK